MYNGSDIYVLSKQIDNFHAEGSFVLAATRSVKFISKKKSINIFYEHLKTIDELAAACKINRILEYETKQSQLFPTMDFECFRSIYDTEKDGKVPAPYVNDISLGRHAVSILDCDNATGEILFENSWGSGWGDNGYGIMSKDYAKQYVHEIILSSDIDNGFTEEKLTPYPDGFRSSQEFAKVWMQKKETDLKKLKWNKEKLIINWYGAMNISGAFTEVFDLVNSYKQIVGWAHLTNYDDTNCKYSTIAELFVWPNFRRKGYGKLLEKQCLENAKYWGSSYVLIPLYEMDDIEGSSSPVRNFCYKLGYTLSFENLNMPKSSGHAKKSI